MTISPRNKEKLPSLIRVKNSDKKKKTVSFSQDVQGCNIAALSKASMIKADIGGLPSKSFSFRHQQSSIREGTESRVSIITAYKEILTNIIILILITYISID